MPLSGTVCCSSAGTSYHQPVHQIWSLYGLLATFLLAGVSHMWCLYQNQEKTRQTLQTTILLFLPAVFVRSWNAWWTTDLCGTWKEINYHTCTVWFPQRSKYHRPACTFRVFCQRGFYSEAARYCYFLRSRKGLRYNMEVWHFKRFTRCWSASPTTTFHSRLPLWQEVPSQSWQMLLQTLWTGNGRTSGKHLICYTILSEI